MVLPALERLPFEEAVFLAFEDRPELGVKDVSRKAGLGGDASMNCRKVRELLPWLAALGRRACLRSLPGCSLRITTGW